jgi:hypothetical protein
VQFSGTFIYTDADTRQIGQPAVLTKFNVQKQYSMTRDVDHSETESVIGGLRMSVIRFTLLLPGD